MKHLIIFLVLGLGVLSAHAQNEKNLVFDANAEARSVSGFTAIEVSGAIDLFLSQGNVEAAAVSANSEEAIGRIRTEVKNGTLHIYFDAKGWNWKTWGNNKMKAYVTFKNLNRVEASGACNVKSTEAIKVSELKIQLSGASDYTGELQVGFLKLDASGASNVRVSGKAEKLEVDALFVEAGTSRARIAKEKYNNGLLTFDEWDIIENDLITRQKTLVQTERDRVIAEALWEQVQGRGVIK
jgi:hypothetical protein